MQNTRGAVTSTIENTEKPILIEANTVDKIKS